MSKNTNDSASLGTLKKQLNSLNPNSITSTQLDNLATKIHNIVNKEFINKLGVDQKTIDANFKKISQTIIDEPGLTKNTKLDLAIAVENHVKKTFQHKNMIVDNEKFSQITTNVNEMNSDPNSQNKSINNLQKQFKIESTQEIIQHKLEAGVKKIPKSTTEFIRNKIVPAIKIASEQLGQKANKTYDKARARVDKSRGGLS